MCPEEIWPEKDQESLFGKFVPSLGWLRTENLGKQTTYHACGSYLLWKYSHLKQECSEFSLSLLWCGWALSMERGLDIVLLNLWICGNLGSFLILLRILSCNFTGEYWMGWASWRAKARPVPARLSQSPIVPQLWLHPPENPTGDSRGRIYPCPFPSRGYVFFRVQFRFKSWSWNLLCDRYPQFHLWTLHLPFPHFSGDSAMQKENEVPR